MSLILSPLSVWALWSASSQVVQLASHCASGTGLSPLCLRDFTRSGALGASQRLHTFDERFTAQITLLAQPTVP